MNRTSVNSSNASKEVKMGIMVTGGFVKADDKELTMKRAETVNQTIPMFDFVENSVGNYEKDAKGTIYAKSNKTGKVTKYVKTRNGDKDVYQVVLEKQKER